VSAADGSPGRWDEPDPDDELQRRTGRALGGVIAATFGVALHLVVGLFVLSAALLAPPWAVVALLVTWALLLAAMLRLRLRRRSPIATLLVPFVMAAVLWLALTLGERVLGWTA
jgi:hypothetical protein